MFGSSKLSVTAMITIVITIKSAWRRPTPFPGCLNLTSPLGSSSGSDNAWRPPHFHCHHHSSLIWTICLFQVGQVLSKFTYLPFICVPLFHFAVRLQPFVRWFHSLYSPPAGSLSPSAPADPWIPGTTIIIIRHLLTGLVPCHFSFPVMSSSLDPGILESKEYMLPGYLSLRRSLRTCWLVDRPIMVNCSLKTIQLIG